MYKAKRTFSTGSKVYTRYHFYSEIPEGAEGYFDKIESKKETADSKPAKKRSKATK